MSLVLIAGESLSVSVDAAATTAESSVHTSYADISGALGSTTVATAGTSFVTLAQTPAGTQWVISGISLTNSDTVTHTYTLSTLITGGTRVTIYVGQLQAGYSIQYDSHQWTIYNRTGTPVQVSGNIVQSVGHGVGVSVNASDPANPIVSLNSGTQASLALANTAVQPPQLDNVVVGLDYISGLVLEYSSGSALTISSGVAGIQSSAKLLTVGSQIGVSGLVLTASTWYHVYLYEAMVGGSLTPELEVVTTAPSTPYLGNARSKTGDTSRRYLGSILTNGSASITDFYMVGNRVIWLVGSGGAFQVVAGGKATTETSFSTASFAPVTALTVNISFQNTSGDAFLNSGVSGLVTMLSIAPNNDVVTDLPNTALTYRMSAATAGSGAFLNGYGYTFGR